jgi:hypothetical protein
MSYEIKIIAKDEGSLKKLLAGLNSVNKELDRTASSHTRGSKAAENFNHKMDKGIIGTGNSVRSFSKLAQSIDGDHNSLVGAYAALAANIFAVSAAFLALKQAAEVEQVVAGLVASGARLGLTYKNTIQEVKELSGGLLSLEQSARSTAQVMAAGFNSDALKRITVVAKDASFALGRDMTESMDRLTRGVIKLEPELLDELGIMVRIDEATQTYARSLGKSASSLTAIEKRQGFLNAVLAEGEAKFGGIADAAGGAGGLTKLAATFADLSHEVFKFLNIAAVPLAAMFSTSKVSLLGGMLLFASSIKGQLVPALTDAADNMQKVAEKSSKLSGVTASNIIANAKGAAGKGGNKAVNDYFKEVQKGEGTLERTRAAQEKLNVAIEKGSPKTNILAYRKQLDGLKEIEAAQLRTASITESANAANAASTGNYRSAVRFTAASIQDYAAHVAVANTKTGIMGKVSRGASIGMYALSASAKTAGIAFLTFLPYLGLIVMALGFVAAAAGAMYKAFVGADVVAAKKELKEITSAIKEKEKAYLTMAASAASAASKELSNNQLVSNTINEQITAVKKLQKAIADKNAEDKASRSGLAKEKLAHEQIFEMKSRGVKIDSRVTASGAADFILNSLKSDIPEVKKATEEAVKSVGGLDKAFSNLDSANIVINSIEKTLGSLGTKSLAVSEAFKALDNSVADFVKSATPTTPYDSLNTSLTNTVLSLAEYRVEADKTGDSAEKLAAILSGLGGNASLLLTPEQVRGLSDYRVAMIEGGAAAEQAKKSMKGMAPEIEKQLLIQQNKVSELQNEAIITASLVQLASARVAKLNTFEARSGENIKARMQAENRVLELQAKQAEAQVEMLRVTILVAEAEALRLKTARELTGQMTSQNLLQQYAADSTNLSTLTGKAKQDAEKRLELLRQEIDVNETIKRAKAGINAAENAAAAIRMGQTSALDQAAAARTEDAKIASRLADTESTIVELTREKVLLDEKLYAIRKGQESLSLEYMYQYIEAQEAIVVAKKDSIEKDRLAKVAAENENKQRLKSAGQLTKKAEENTDAIIKGINDEAKLRTDILDLTTAQNILETGRVDTLASIYEKMQTIKAIDREILTNAAEVTQAYLDQSRALQTAKREAQGIVQTPKQAQQEAIDIAMQRLDAAIKERDIKFEVIDAEIALMKLKTEVEKENARIAYAAAKAAGSDTLAESYKSLIGLYDKMLGTQTSLESRGAQAAGAGTKASDGVTDVSELVVQGTKRTPGTLDALAASRRASAQLPVDSAVGAAQAATMTKTLSDFMKDMNNLKNVSTEIGKIWEGDGSLGSKIASSILQAEGPLNKMKEQFKELGPEGQIMVALIEGTQSISMAFQDMSAVLSDTSSTFSDKFAAMAGIVSSVLSTIQQVTKASSDAKVAAIDREIAAEQKRDGKSAESLAKIKAMESKKDAIAKKAFEVNKKLMMAQAVVSAAAGVAMALGSAPPPYNFVLAGMVAAMGAAQLAIIAGTSYQSSASSAASAATPSALSVGTRSSSVDLAKSNTNVGGEHGYLTGAQGQGTNASNFKPRAYGGYGNAGMIVGEKGPELFVPSTPGTVVSNDNMTQAAPINANISINAIDAEGVERVLTDQRGHIIGMLREAANANGQNFLENVDTIKYRRTGGRRL